MQFMFASMFLTSALLAGEAGNVKTADAACSDQAHQSPVIALTVDNITNDEGNLRAQIYSDDPEEFLAKGKKLVRVEVPAKQGEAEMCVPVPNAGTFALVVMHDVNANGKADIFSEGFGFSNNPKLGLSKPDHDKVVFTVAEGVSKQRVSLKYLLGSEADKDKRSRARRR